MFAITKFNKETMYNIMDDIVDTVSSYFDKVLFIIDSRIIYDTGTYRKINFFFQWYPWKWLYYIHTYVRLRYDGLT